MGIRRDLTAWTRYLWIQCQPRSNEPKHALVHSNPPGAHPVHVT
jgi:hypothetical protein